LIEIRRLGPLAKGASYHDAWTALAPRLPARAPPAVGRLWVSLVGAFLVAAVNAYEIWIAVRYGKLLVVAWCQLAGASQSSRRAPMLGWIGVAVLLIASNLVFGYYLAHYFHETTLNH
jgi:hypothetical protein